MECLKSLWDKSRTCSSTEPLRVEKQQRKLQAWMGGSDAEAPSCPPSRAGPLKHEPRPDELTGGRPGLSGSIPLILQDPEGRVERRWIGSQG
ncbi:hypothetical protein SRHO_G00037830 [Serrasalmus rhombeus]